MLCFRSMFSPLGRSTRNASLWIGSSDIATRTVSTSMTMKRRLRAAKANYKKPELETAQAMPLSVQEMDNSTLVMLGGLNNHAAHKEILKRHIMSTDLVSYENATEKYEIISAKNKEGMYLLTLPYNIGIFAALSSGFYALPMVFHLPTAEWFNINYVTTDVPEPRDLETIMEVGAWTWNWMEPALGTISFVLLTLQFSRAQIQNLGAKPYTERMKQWRGERLATAFPEYNASVIIQYSKSASLHAVKREPFDGHQD